MSASSAGVVSGATAFSKEAARLLGDPISKERELLSSFLAMLKGPDIPEAIEDGATFSSILRYALDRGFVKQNLLADRIKYVNSQVGRWAAGKAAPPQIVRAAVIDTMRDLIQERHDTLSPEPSAT